MALALGSAETTNNWAEYTGLYRGLQEAQRQGLSNLEVVGDSMMILSMFHRNRSPRVKSLAAIHSKARRIAIQLQITEWHHHRRNWNRMADCAANAAMDHKRSIATHTPSQWPLEQQLRDLLENDLQHWVLQRASTLLDTQPQELEVPTVELEVPTVPPTPRVIRREETIPPISSD
jgi:hypothetical protein